MEREDIDFERLSAYLKALAHPARLEILWRLRIPASAAEVVVRPRRRDEGLSQERAMSRQTVSEHIDTLENVGVVNRMTTEDGGAAQFVTSAQHVFALIEDLRKLSAIEPATRVDVDTTFTQGGTASARWVAGPKLILVSGPWEGRVFALDGEGPWTVGRAKSQTVGLTYDPYASSESGILTRDGPRYQLEAAPSARNAPRVNFSLLDKPRALAPGDILSVGRSHLVFQDR